MLAQKICFEFSFEFFVAEVHQYNRYGRAIMWSFFGVVIFHQLSIIRKMAKTIFFESFHIDKRNALICFVCQSEAEDWIFGICKILKIVPHRPLLGILQPCLRILLPSSPSPDPPTSSPPSPTFSSSWSSACWGLRRQSLCPHSLECYSQCLDLTAFSNSTPAPNQKWPVILHAFPPPPHTFLIHCFSWYS